MTDEEALITASKRGDSAALDALVRAHQDRVYAFAMRMCRNVEDAKDILQETFLGMVRSLREFREEKQVHHMALSHRVKCLSEEAATPASNEPEPGPGAVSGRVDAPP